MTTPTTDGWLAVARPALRRGVQIGPALLRGAEVVHIVGDRETQAFLRVGPREAFLMEQLDGRRSLAEISRLYAERFGKRLAAEHWQQLLGTLGGHALIDPAEPSRLAEIRARAEQNRRAGGRSPLLWRRPVPGAAGLAVRLAARIGWLLNPLLAVPLTLLGVVVAAYTLLDWSPIWSAATGTPSRWSASIAGLAISWLVIAWHELFHGIACVRYGGRPAEIGLMWRFPLIAPYCKVDDVVTFSRRAHRVVTAFAGIYVNLAALLPFAALWWWGPRTGWWHSLAAVLLLAGVASALLNLLPVLRLDGYHMLEHATSTMNLQSEAFRFAARFLRRGRAGVAGYPRRARVLYPAYAAASVLILGPVAGLVLRSWYLTLAGLWGPPTAAGVLVIEAVLIVILLRWAIRRHRGATEAN